jgi:hypothetical protein
VLVYRSIAIASGTAPPAGRIDDSAVTRAVERRDDQLCVLAGFDRRVEIVFVDLAANASGVRAR